MKRRIAGKVGAKGATFTRPAVQVAACAGILAVCTSAQAIITDNPLPAIHEGTSPYQGIIDRNVFGLRPPPPPPDPNEKPATPPPKMTLTGIITLGGYPRALLKVPAQPGKAGDAGKAEQSSILREGERDGDLEVVHIDAVTKKVEVTYAGQAVTVTFDKDAGKNLSGQPGTQPPMGAIPSPVGMPGRPGTLPSPGAPNPNFGLPARPMRYQQQGSSAYNPAGASAYNPAGAAIPAGGGAPGVSVGGVSLPAFGSAPASYNTQQPPQNTLSPDEQAVLIEAQREQAKAKGDPIANILPPTVLNPTANVAPGSLPEQPAPSTPTTPTRQQPRFAPTIPQIPQLPQ